MWRVPASCASYTCLGNNEKLRTDPGDFSDLWANKYLSTYNLYGPVCNVLDACISITRGSERGLGPGILEFLSPVKCEPPFGAPSLLPHRLPTLPHHPIQNLLEINSKVRKELCGGLHCGHGSIKLKYIRRLFLVGIWFHSYGNCLGLIWILNLVCASIRQKNWPIFVRQTRYFKSLNFVSLLVVMYDRDICSTSYHEVWEKSGFYYLLILYVSLRIQVII